ncbi:MAG: heavy metal translocating P-type ATPase metal-binding domain-containing protein [Proteobacteria bacterium]|nr:heavy metal translocating P-type ATPase metal-binding domain-containing protein [Pseudomonadota bacterium]
MAHVLMKTHFTHPSVQSKETVRNCRHCQSKLSAQLDDEFCCHGCQSAYGLIASLELDRFYEIVQQNPDSLRPVPAQRRDYRLFDSTEFQKDFVEAEAAGRQTAHFYLENMSCYACLWVCEQITRQIDPDARLAINLASGEASLDFSAGSVALSAFFEKFEALGYAVSPHRDFQRDSKSEIARIGVALFCLTNIMMLAFPEYLGASSLEARFRLLFRGISALLAAFTTFYAGWPFLQGAFYSLRKKEVHLDLPIALALVVCFAYSLFHTITGHVHVYYDSSAAVVALLLIGRWVGARALRKVARRQAQFFDGDLRVVRCIKDDGNEELLPLSSVPSGTQIKVLPGELVAMKCRLLSPIAVVNYHLLTGEADNQSIQEGQELYAGAVNGSHPIIVESLEAGLQSFLLLC